MSLVVDIRLEQPTGFVLEAAFEVPAGSTVALLGPNGAGKSTAVWAVAGAAPITSGRISLAGRVLDAPTEGVFVPPEERGIGALFQDVLLLPHLDVAANLAFAARRASRSGREAGEAAADLLREHDLEYLAEVRSDRLSGGQAQRIGLLRALAGDPDLLLLDEPLSALDVGSRARVRRNLIRHLAGFPGPRLLVTHDPAEAGLLADEVVVMEGGKVTQTGTPEEILHAPRTRYAADLAGLNLLTGTAAGGLVTVADGRTLQVGDPSAEGDVLLTIHPRVVSIYPEAPSGSPRNTWQGTISSIESMTGGLCRVQFDHPLDLTAEITHQAREALGLAPGLAAWVSIKATEIGVLPG